MQTCTIPLTAPHKSGMFRCFFPFSSIQAWVYFFSNILFSCTDLFLHCCQSRQWWGEGEGSVTVHSRKSKPAENTCHQQEVEFSCLLDKCFLDLNKAKKEQAQCFIEAVCGRLNLKRKCGRPALSSENI